MLDKLILCLFLESQKLHIMLMSFIFPALDGSLFLSNRNSFGDTPLHLLARSNRCVGIIKLLIRSGASLTVRNKQVTVMNRSRVTSK